MNYLPLNKYLIKIVGLYVDYSIEHLIKIIPKDKYIFNKYINIVSILDIVVLSIQKGSSAQGSHKI